MAKDRITPGLLGVGEYEVKPKSSAGVKSSVADARNYFFKALDVRAPKVLEDLAYNTYPIYLRFYGFPIVRTYVRAWAFRWNLDVDWCWQRAEDTLAGWAMQYRTQVPGEPQDPASDPKRKWSIPVVPYEGPPTSEVAKGTFTYEWEPLTEQRAVARERIQAEFSQHLKQHFIAVDRWALEQGLQPSPRKRTLKHFDWLVQFQVLGKEAVDIHRDLLHIPHGKVGPASEVTKEIGKTAVLIGLPLRDGRRGPPPKGARVRSRKS